MKTRQEMIYDFMVALCANSDSMGLISANIAEDLNELEAAQVVYLIACDMADQYLRSLG